MSKRERTPEDDREFRAWIARAKDRRTAPIIGQALDIVDHDLERERNSQ